ncbi:MAG: hypothetical protein M3O22_02795 [Pseudomonadota bacterium]|nr:hypothetical protein [Pseudomonadota bacterium]
MTGSGAGFVVGCVMAGVLSADPEAKAEPQVPEKRESTPAATTLVGKIRFRSSKLIRNLAILEPVSGQTVYSRGVYSRLMVSAT